MALQHSAVSFSRRLLMTPSTSMSPSTTASLRTAASLSSSSSPCAWSSFITSSSSSTRPRLLARRHLSSSPSPAASSPSSPSSSSSSSDMFATTASSSSSHPFSSSSSPLLHLSSSLWSHRHHFRRQFASDAAPLSDDPVADDAAAAEEEQLTEEEEAAALALAQAEQQQQQQQQQLASSSDTVETRSYDVAALHARTAAAHAEKARLKAERAAGKQKRAVSPPTALRTSHSAITAKRSQKRVRVPYGWTPVPMNDERLHQYLNPDGSFKMNPGVVMPDGEEYAYVSGVHEDMVPQAMVDILDEHEAARRARKLSRNQKSRMEPYPLPDTFLVGEDDVERARPDDWHTGGAFMLVHKRAAAKKRFNNVLQATPRVRSSKHSARRVRDAGRVPAILFGGQDPHAKELVSLCPTEIGRYVQRDGALFCRPLQVKIDRFVRPRWVLPKTIRFHPLTHAIENVTFQRLVPGDTVKVRVPVVLDGAADADAIKQGAIFIQQTKHIDCLWTVGYPTEAEAERAHGPRVPGDDGALQPRMAGATSHLRNRVARRPPGRLRRIAQHDRPMLNFCDAVTEFRIDVARMQRGDKLHSDVIENALPPGLRFCKPGFYYPLCSFLGRRGSGGPVGANLNADGGDVTATVVGGAAATS